jgi:hypothetical protein
MHPVKKGLILVIIIASFVIIYNLFTQNENIKKEIQKQIDVQTKEGFETTTSKTVQNEMTELRESAEKKGLELTIKPIADEYMEYPLREFMIKSSYNSAIVNNTASKDAIAFVLGRGCRLLDFEIYTRQTPNGKDEEYVSYSEDPEYRKIETGLTLSLENALNAVAANAFSPPSPAPGDPLFIQLRIKNNSNSAYSRISSLIDKILDKRIYTVPVTGSTPLKDINGKVIIILDVLSAPDYNRYSKCLTTDLMCVPLTTKIGMLSGTTDLPKYSYMDYYDLTQKPIMIASNSDRTDVRTFMMVAPPEVGGNKMTIPNDDAMLLLPAQMLLVPFYRQNDDLKKYEAKFNTCNSSFCAIGPVQRRANRKNAEKLQ